VLESEHQQFLPCRKVNPRIPVPVGKWNPRIFALS
jgi:hypothetical protein